MRNPILFREFIGIARAGKTSFIIGLYLVLLAGLLLILWPSGGVQSVVTDGAKKIFAIFFSVNLALLLLIIPAFSSGAITLERENGTYPALFFTLLSPWDILLGKLGASAAIVVIMTLLSMPMAAVCSLAGGMDSIFMVKVMAVLLITAVSYGILGLACSSLCAHTTGAVLLNYVIILFLAGATWLPSALLSNLLPDLNGLFQTLRSISPFDAMLYLLYPDTYRLTMVTEGFSCGTPFSIYITASVILSVLCLLIFRWKIRQVKFASHHAKGQVYSDAKKALKRKLTFPFYLFDPLKRKKPIGRFSNPVFVSEMRSKLFANTNFVIRTMSVIFIVSLLMLTLLAFQMGDEIHAGSVRAVAIVFQIGIVALLAPGVSSGLITNEITAGTFVALRMTPLSPFTIVFGKLKATFFYALIFLISSIFILLAMAYLEPASCFPETSMTDPDYFPQLWKKMTTEEGWLALFCETYHTIGIWLVILLLSTFTFLSAGLFCSAFAKTTPQATVGAYSITGVICLVTLIPIPLAEKFSYGMSYFLLAFNPIAAAMQITSGSLANYPSLWIHNIIVLLILNLIFLAAATGRVFYLFHKPA